jgi:glycosyltransferase involved in cell wall biosynthesis
VTELGFSIVIPAYGRIEPLKYTLRSAASAIRRMPASGEIIVIDDGSPDAPLADSLAGFPLDVPANFIRQPNQGAIAARLNGLRHARGRYLLFLDSDDLIAPDKLAAHWEAAERTAADFVYDDMARAELAPDYTAQFIPSREIADDFSDFAELLLRIMPVPHGPSYRRAWLAAALQNPLVPPHRRYDPVGDIWIYYNLLLQTPHVQKLRRPLTATGPHGEPRYSQHWERLGVAALLLAENFLRRCPATAATAGARRVVGESAFDSWRRLPRDVDAGYANRLLAVWRASPPSRLDKIGGRNFGRLAHFVGPELAGRLLRLSAHTYASCRTMSDHELSALLANSPAHEASRE